jgi:hypothetical protein
MIDVVKSKKITRQDKEIVICKLVLQELCMIFLSYCVFYILANAPFYKHRIMGG